MTTKILRKNVDKVPDAKGGFTEKLLAVELAIMDDVSEIGRVNINEHGGNFSFNGYGKDLENVAAAIANALNV